jgi:Na+-transporting methylmalonyl-CoA/oxaloacetate decarboxylase gamma subunit
LQQLQQSKADAKGLLVDMLLSKGMLKIDAMSLADTLEGYPDLFVSALIGESLSGGSAVGPNSVASSSQQEHAHNPTLRQADLVSASERHDLMLFENSSGISPGAHPAMDTPTSAGAQRIGSHELWQHYPSYGQLGESDMDPTAYVVHSAEAESRKESLCMMLGFSLFAVIPSLIYTWVPTILFGSHDSAGIHVNPSSQHVAAFVNPNTLVISLTACVMWCLGVWKSRFLDSNWLMFGIETVLVLLVCITVAYGLGALLNRIFLPNDYLLEVVKQVTPVESEVASVSTAAVQSTGASTTAHHGTLPNHHFYVF